MFLYVLHHEPADSAIIPASVEIIRDDLGVIEESAFYAFVHQHRRLILTSYVVDSTFSAFTS